MREIRFRAYDQVIEKYREQGQIQLSSSGKPFQIIPLNAGYKIEKLEGIVIEFFTGLKDKNGVEIYEGDWIQSAPGYTSYIDFKDGAFLSIYKHPEDGEELLITDLDLKNTVVIGNIHE